MLKLDDHESVDGHSAGALRSLELDQPTYVGGVPYGSTEHSQLVNRTALMHLLGVQKLVGLDGCIKRFKLGHREVKIQSASEPLALRRISLNECQEGGTLHTATVSIRLGRQWQSKALFSKYTFFVKSQYSQKFIWPLFLGFRPFN